MAEKTKVLSNLINLKEVEEFKWEKQHHTTFDEIKGYLSKPPVLMPLLKGRVTQTISISCKRVYRMPSGTK